MSDLERMTVKEAAATLHRSARSIRRYLAQGKLEYEKQPTSAGFRYMITARSVEQLSRQLQGRQMQGGTAGATDLAVQVAALQALVERQNERIAGLTLQVGQLSDRIQRLLPPAEEERKPWWRRLWRRQEGPNNED